MDTSIPPALTRTRRRLAIVLRILRWLLGLLLGLWPGGAL